MHRRYLAPHFLRPRAAVTQASKVRSPSVSSCKSQLKIYLFEEAYEL